MSDKLQLVVSEKSSAADLRRGTQIKKKHLDEG